MSLENDKPGPGECEDANLLNSVLFKDHPLARAKGYRWAFGDLDSDMARALKHKPSMNMLYEAIKPF